MSSIRKSLVISFADKYCTLIIQFVSTMILARLLSPEEIGIYSLGAVIIGFAQMIRDFGVSNYIIQEKDLTRERLRTAFGVTLCLAWAAALALFALSQTIADFYNSPDVKIVIRTLAISLFFIPINSTILGLLRRKLDFTKLMMINVSSTIAHTTISLSLAYAGFGFMSLAWAAVGGTLTTLAVGLLNKPPEAVFLPSLSEFRRIFSFGSASTGASLLSEAGLSAPDLTISRNLGFESLGYYSRAVGFVSIFNFAVTAAINPVVLPAFSKATREGRSIASSYLLALSYMTGLSWSFFIFLALMTFPIIRILYGDQWDLAVEPARILCLAFALQSLSLFAAPALIALGKVHNNFKIQAQLQIPRVVFTIWASFYGLEYVAYVQVALYFFSFVIYHRQLHISLGVRIRDIFDNVYKSILLTTICGLATYTGREIFSDVGVFYQAMFCGVFWAVAFLTSIYALKHPLANEIQKVFLKLKGN